MKQLINLKSFIVLFLASISLVSCDLSNDENNTINTSVVDVIKANPNLSSLVAALEENPDSNLLNLLSNFGSYTVLAPTNAAFNEFLNGAALSDIPAADLEALLLNHIVLTQANAATFVSANDNGVFYTKTAGSILIGDQRSFINIFFDVVDDVLSFNGEANVIEANLVADNGYVHIVDKVIKIPSIVDFVVADSRFSSLLEALTAPDQPDFPTILNTPNGTAPAPFTVFAPINEAFTALETVPTGEELTKVLQHHVIAEENIFINQISTGLESPATLEGDILKFRIQNGFGFIEDGSGNTDAEFIAGNLDIQAKNGIIHAINKVLIPDMTN